MKRPMFVSKLRYVESSDFCVDFFVDTNISLKLLFHCLLLLLQLCLLNLDHLHLQLVSTPYALDDRKLLLHTHRLIPHRFQTRLNDPRLLLEELTSILHLLLHNISRSHGNEHMVHALEFSGNHYARRHRDQNVILFESVDMICILPAFEGFIHSSASIAFSAFWYVSSI